MIRSDLLRQPARDEVTAPVLDELERRRRSLSSMVDVFDMPGWEHIDALLATAEHQATAALETKAADMAEIHGQRARLALVRWLRTELPDKTRAQLDEINAEASRLRGDDQT